MANVIIIVSYPNTPLSTALILWPSGKGFGLMCRRFRPQSWPSHNNNDDNGFISIALFHVRHAQLR